MDDTAVTTRADRTMTMTGAGGALTPDPAIVDPAEHNIVFTSLVTSDKDIVGLVAYSIYKQNKYDWLHAFSRLQGRMPDESEAQSYLYGESTPRRLATYRHLAEAVLAGRGPDVQNGEAPSTAPVYEAGIRRAAPVQPKAGFQLSARAIVGLCIALGVLLILFWLLHSGAPLPPTTAK